MLLAERLFREVPVQPRQVPEAEVDFLERDLHEPARLDPLGVFSVASFSGIIRDREDELKTGCY